MTKITDLPALKSSRANALRWDGIDGLALAKAASWFAKAASWKKVDGRDVLDFVVAPTPGKHRLGIAAQGLEPDRFYRVTAWIKTDWRGKIVMDARDGSSPNGRLATFGGAEPKPRDGWLCPKIDVHSADGKVFAYVALADSGDSLDFDGDGQTRIAFGGIDVEPIEASDADISEPIAARAQWSGKGRSLDLDGFLAGYMGATSIEEGQALRRYAERCQNAIIVEIGSFKGKSAVALAFGQSHGRFAESGLVYCVDPHLPFTGIYGGVFGPEDRRDFYAVMLETGFFDRVCLVNLKSDVAAKGWRQPIGLLFIDGDHSLEGVRLDIAAWERHLEVGGVVIFDDAKDPLIGPYHAIKELMAAGRFERLESFGKMAALRKIAANESAAVAFPAGNGAARA